MKNLKTVTIILSSIFIGATFSSFAMSASSYSPVKIAVVDVPAVVAASGEVNTLKNVQKTKIDDLDDFVTKAKADVDSAKDPAQKKKLEDGYNKELNERKNKIVKDYAATLSNIEKNISAIIAKKAKDENYQIVLSKGIVLYGGDDITKELIKTVK